MLNAERLPEEGGGNGRGGALKQLHPSGLGRVERPIWARHPSGRSGKSDRTPFGPHTLDEVRHDAHVMDVGPPGIAAVSQQRGQPLCLLFAEHVLAERGEQFAKFGQARLKRGQVRFVRSTLRTVSANGTCPV